MSVLTLKETAKLLGLSEITVWRHIQDKKIPATKIGNRWRILKSDIDKLFEQGKSEPSIQRGVI